MGIATRRKHRVSSALRDSKPVQSRGISSATRAEIMYAKETRRTRMPSKSFRRRLDDTEREWLRVRFTTERGRVTAFTVQYETVIGGQPIAVARYDTAHGYPHLDVLDRRGRVVAKTRMADLPSLGAALTYAEHEMRNSWRRYREAFFKDRR